jgi:hypothetical protein
LVDPLLRYFDAVDKAIASCGWMDISTQKLIIPKYQFKPGEKIYWSFEASFPTGQKLIASESHHWNDIDQHCRKIKYRLMFEKGELIFQVDTHQTAIPFDDCPHLHIGPKEDQIVQEGDPQLKGHSLQNFDFLKMRNWVQDYLEDGRLPWQR